MIHLQVKILKRILSNFGLLPEAYPEECGQLWSEVNKIELLWEKTNEGYQVKPNNQRWELKINQNAGEPRYTLFIGKKATLSCDTLPDNWHLSP